MGNFSITMESNELEENKELARVIRLAEASTSAKRSDDPLRGNLEYRKECQDKIETLLGILRLLFEQLAEIDEPLADQREAKLEILYQAQIDAVWPCHQKEVDSLNAQLIEAHAEHEAQMKAQRVKSSELEKENTERTKDFMKLYLRNLEMQDELYCCNQQIASLRETGRTMQKNMSKLQSNFDKTRVVNFRQADHLSNLSGQLNSTQLKLHTTLADLKKCESALANSDELCFQMVEDQADINQRERRQLVSENLELVGENLQLSKRNLELSKRNLELVEKNQALDTECNSTRAELAAFKDTLQAASLDTMLFI